MRDHKQVDLAWERSTESIYVTQRNVTNLFPFGSQADYAKSTFAFFRYFTFLP